MVKDSGQRECTADVSEYTKNHPCGSPYETPAQNWPQTTAKQWRTTAGKWPNLNPNPDPQPKPDRNPNL